MRKAYFAGNLNGGKVWEVNKGQGNIKIIRISEDKVAVFSLNKRGKYNMRIKDILKVGFELKQTDENIEPWLISNTTFLQLDKFQKCQRAESMENKIINIIDIFRIANAKRSIGC
jgi:hypothetical protein